MDFKDFYDYRYQKNEENFLKMNKENEDEMNNQYKKKVEAYKNIISEFNAKIDQKTQELNSIN